MSDEVSCRKGTTIEYLMTYGWVIMIVLTVAGVFAYYGIFSPSGFFLSSAAKGFGQLQVLNPWGISAASGVMNLNLQNRLGETIVIVGANATIDGSFVEYDVTKALPSSTSAVISFSPTSWTAKKVGAQYTAEVKINYIYQGSIFSSAGTISGTYS
jgi:hypothetical protein